MGCEIGRIRPTSVFERAGESRMTPPAGHGVEPAPVDGEGAHTGEGRGLAIDGAGGRPGSAPGELVLADLIGGQRGGLRVAAEEGGDGRSSPGARPARGQAHTRPLTPPVAVWAAVCGGAAVLAAAAGSRAVGRGANPGFQGDSHGPRGRAAVVA